MNNANCIICTDFLNVTAEIYTTPCGHLFHHECLVKWLDQSATCPQCRHKTTLRSSHRIYFNLANTEHIPEDAATILAKLENVEFEMKLKNKELSNVKEKCAKMKSTTAGLRLELAEAEGKLRSHSSVVLQQKSEISLLKSKCKERDILVQDNLKLRNELKTVNTVNVALSGSREQFNELLMREENIESLQIILFQMKKALLKEEQKKSELEHKHKNLKCEITKQRRTIADLEISNEVLRKECQSAKLNWEREKEYLKSTILTMKENKKSDDSINRIIMESPAPIPQKPIESQPNSTPQKSRRSPPEEKNGDFTRYVSMSGVKYITNVGKGPLFKRTLNDLSGFQSSQDGLTCDGLGGQAKDESPFPVSKHAVGFKRARYTSSATTKFKNVAPILKTKK